MKISVITDEISQDLQEAAEVARSYQLDAIELRSVWDKQPHELTAEELEKIRGICKNQNMKICAIASPFFKCEFTEAEIEKQLELLKKTIQVSRELGCRMIRGFSFWGDEDFDTILPQLAKAYEEPIRMLQAADMILVLEPDPSVYACNGERVARLVRQIGSPQVRILWDAGNDFYSPEYELPVPDGYRLVRWNIAHIHLKDVVIRDGCPQCVELGKGIVNWPEQLRMLKRDGYGGYMSLETHYRTDAQLSEALLRLPGGTAFSQGARQASEDCLRALRKMLQAI